MPTLFDLHGIDLNEEAPQQPEKAGFLRRAVGDTGISLVKGAIGVPEAIVGVADLATGGQAGRLAEQAGFRPKEARAALDELLSPQQQAENREVQQASGFMETARAMLKNPTTIYHAAVESAPSLLPAGVVARGAMAVAPRIGGAFAAGLGEGVVSAGQTAEQVRQETADGLLTGEQSAIAGASGALTGIIGGVAGKIANKLGIGDVNQLVAGVQQAGPAAQKSFVRAMLEGFATEGVLQELPQSAQEQIAQNVALGKPWDEGVGAAAASGALAGGLMGGIAGPIQRSPAQPDPVTESLDKLAKAGTVSEMIQAAQEVVGSPTMPAGFDATRENLAMTAMERQMADDASAMRFSGGRESAQPAPTTRRAPQAQASATIVPDAPMLDRLATVQESLRDARVRDQVRQQFGEDGLNTLLYYADVANRPSGADGIPDATRERMLGLAEGLISRATLQPVAQPGAVGAAPQAQQLEAPDQVPRIGLDTTPTGRMRADATGNVAPETRADAISTAQRVNARDERLRGGPGMETQTPRDKMRGAGPGVMVGEGSLESATFPAREPRRLTNDPTTPTQPAAPKRAEPDTRLRDLPQRLAEQADPVTAYVERQRTVDTPEARQFVRDFNAGKITRRDVIRVMQEQGADPLAGKVYRTRSAASAEARKSGKVVEQVEGGFTVVEQDSGTERGIRGDAGMAAGAGAGRGDQPGGSAQPVGSRAAADAGRGDATGLNGQRGGEDVPVRAGNGGDGAVASGALELKDEISAAYRVASGFFGKDIITPSIQSDWQRLLDAADARDTNMLSALEDKYRKDEERDGLGAGTSGAGPKKVKSARPGAAQLPRFARSIRQAIAREQSTSRNPGTTGWQNEIDRAATEAATSPSNDLPEPTDAQKEAGNYKKGHVRISGMDVAISLPNPWEISQDEFVRLVTFAKEGSTAFPWAAKWGDRILEAENEEYDHPDLGKTIVQGRRFSKTKREAETIARGAHKRAVRRAALNGETPTAEALKAYPDLQPAQESPAEQPAASRATADAWREQEFVHNGVRIYPTTVNVGGERKAMWGVESAENKAKREAGERHGFGDSLFATQEQARAAADRQIQRDAERAEFERRKTEIEAEKQAEIAARKADTINGFLDGKAPNTQELIRKALDKQYRFDGVIRSVRKQVEWLDENGTLEVGSFDEPKIKPMSRTQFNRATQREQDAHEKKMREAGTKTVYLVSGSEIGKYAYDYAQHLIARKNSAVQQPAQPEQPAKRYAGPADVSSRAGQMELANRGGTIAALKAMNAQLRAIAPEEAWADANIEDAADLDALRDQISVALVRANRAGSAEQDSPLRKRLEEASGADLRAVFDALGLAGGARMIQADRVKALMSEDAQAVSDALDDVQSDGEPAAAEAPAQPPAANQPALTGSDSPADVASAAGQGGLFDSPAKEAANILDAAEVTGKERIDALKDIKAGTITTEELKDAYPAKIGARLDDLDAKFSAAAAADKNLIITHNLTAQNLLHAVKMGGLPVPSLAITKKDTPLTGFGEITLLGDSNLADPKGYASTKVYGADIYSPRYPSVTFEFTPNMRKRGEAILRQAMEATGQAYIEWSEVEKDGPREFERNTAFLWKFLTDKGLTPDVKRTEVKPLSPEMMPFAEGNLDRFDLMRDEAFIAAAWKMRRKFLLARYEGNEAETDAEMNAERERVKERGQFFFGNDLARQIENYRRDLRDNGKIDRDATRRALQNQVREADLSGELEAAARQFVEDLSPNERIFQGFTNSGNRKYIPHTLENVVKLLKKELRGGESFNYGVGSLRAKFTPEFKTLAAIKKEKGRLVSAEEFEPVKKEVDDELFGIATELGLSLDQTIEVFEDAPKMGVTRAIDRAIRDYNSSAIVDEEIKQRVAQFLTRLRNLPTAYFEAKILRDVSLSEFKAAVVPEGSSKEVLDALKKAGIADIKKYERGNDASRAAAIQSFEDLRFSRRDAMDSVAEQGMPAHLVERYAKQYEAAGLHRVNVARNIGDLPARLQAKMSGAGDDVRGAYFRAEDQVWLFSDRLNSMDELHFVVIHEAFHRGLGHLFGEDGRKIMRQMYATNKALRDRADLVAKELKIDRDEAIEEALADMAGEGGVESLRGWKGLVQLIRKWLQGLATRLGVPLRFSDAQIRAFVAGVAGAGLRAQKAEPVLLTRERDMVMASREGQRDQTDTREFKRWFGDSKVVDAEGKPLVVYHGTAGNFSEFSPDFAGSTTYSASGLDGFFFTGDADTASKYAKVAQKTQHEMYGRFYSNANVMPVYLALNNPLVYRKQRGDASTLMDTLKRRVIADAKAAGNDGVVFQGFKDTPNGRGDSADVYVAFSPEQIKSAIGNSGAFDPENADIRFSRSSTLDAINQQAIRDKVSDLFSNAGEKVSWWDKTIGTQYNKAKKHPAFKKVFDHVQQYVEDTSTLANEAADKAPAILPKLESVRDVFAAHARGLSTEDKVAVAAPIFEGTLDWARIGGKLVRIDDAAKSAEQMSTAQKARRLVDDGRVSQEEVDRWEKSALPIYEGAIRSRYEQAYLTPGVVFNRQELRDLFKLNERQIEQYEQFRSAVNESLDQVATADALRLLGESPAELRAMAMGDRAAFRAGLVDYMEERIAEEEDTDVREQLRQTMADIEDKFNRVDDMKARGYAPLMRFGKFLVSVKGAEGEQEWFSLHETKAEANKMARELQGDPQFRGRVRQGVLSEEAYKLFSSIPVESLEMFAGALGAEKSAVFQEYLRMTKNNRSALKRLIQRKGTAGFSDEVSRVLASFVTSNARLAAGAMNMPAAKEAADAIRDGDLKDEGVKLIETVQNPTDTAGVLRGLMFTHFIGGSIASALVNVTQPVMMTLPWLSQWGGGAKAASRLMASARMAAGGKIADTELAKALERAEKDGIVSPQEIHHLTAEAMATWGKNPWLKRVAFIWSAPFSVAEQFNRRVSFLAAYKTAKEEGIADPFAFAQEAVVETQGLYNKGNSANWTRNPIGATALTFKQYSVHYLEWIKRMWNAGEPGSRERTEGRRAVLLAMALLFAAGGAEGLPFAEDLDDLADTIMQALGFDTSAKGWKREFIAKTLGLGDEGADVLMRGLSAVPGIPLDVSMRMGMGNLLPGTGMLLKSTTDASRDIAELAGPAGSLLTQWKDAGKKALDGDIPGAMLGAMPGAIQNMGKAASMWMNGEARDTKGRRIMQTDEIDGFMRFLGFNPSEIARESARLSEQDRRVRLTRAVESSIADQWAQGMRDGNADAVQEARAQLQEWNDTNPESRISISSAQIKRRLKDLGEDRSARFERATPKELRGSVHGALH